MSAATDLFHSVRIKVGLLADNRVSGLDVNVDVDNGVAYLSGTVETEDQKLAAEEIAASVEGVEEVENHITVAPLEDQYEEIEEKAVQGMPTGIPGMIGPAMAPPAYGGPAPGVYTALPPDTGVLDTGDALADRVRNALSEDERVFSRDIKVRAEGGTIFLYGRVESFDEFNAVEETVSGVPGVQEIYNDLEVDEAAQGGCFGY